MIIPMQKYSFLIYHKDYADFLKDVQKIGVVHVQEKTFEPDEVVKEKQAIRNRYAKVLKKLEERDTEFAKAKKREKTTEEILEDAEKLFDEKEDFEQRQTTLEKEFVEGEHWGNFSIEKLTNLKEFNIDVRFFICSEKKFENKWNDNFNLEIVNTIDGKIYFVVLTTPNEEIKINAEEVKMPLKSLTDIKTEISHCKQKIDELDHRLDCIAKNYLEPLNKEYKIIDAKKELSLAYLCAENQLDDKVKLLHGWVPTNKQDELNKYLDKKQILYISEKPTTDDQIPILLKNNRFAKLFEPIGKMFSLPDYHEIDLTAFLAPFFMFFFGFCLGDAGYGVIILLGTTIYKFKAKKELKPILSLAQFLGIATIIFGIITGTLFGIPLLEVESMKEYHKFFFNNDQMFYGALIFGIVQIFFGMFIRAANQIRQFGFIYSLSTFGWIIMLASILDTAIFEKITNITQITLYIGIGLIVLFNDPRSKILVSIGKGVWDLYNITGLVGDALSYIRLFALGVASAILGNVINQIAYPMYESGGFSIIFFVIFLLVGHTLNFFIAGLGAFVHPMRLTFVEFYKNAGFKGGGKQYTPLSTK